MNARFPAYYPDGTLAAENARKAILFWGFLDLADQPGASEELATCISDFLSKIPYFCWNTKSADYYPVLASREHDRLCFFIESQTNLIASELSLHKFLATLENLEARNKKNGS